MESREARQLLHVERLLQRQKDMDGFGYEDKFITVSIEEVRGAIAEGGTEWDDQQAGVEPGLLKPSDIRRIFQSAEAAGLTVGAICPECEQGKHGICDGQAMRGDDFVECGCKHTSLTIA